MSNVAQTDANQSPGFRRIATSCLLYAGVLLLAFPLFAGIGWSQFGANGIWSALVAMSVCLVAGELALVVSCWAGVGTQGVNGVLGGMLIRMGMPLAVAFLLYKQQGPLAEAGILYMILGYYLLSLVVETLLSVRLTAGRKAALSDAKVSQAS